MHKICQWKGLLIFTEYVLFFLLLSKIVCQIFQINLVYRLEICSQRCGTKSYQEFYINLPREHEYYFQSCLSNSKSIISLLWMLFIMSDFRWYIQSEAVKLFIKFTFCWLSDSTVKSQVSILIQVIKQFIIIQFQQNAKPSPYLM